MAENNKWNKKIFSMLLTEAKGVRSWLQFAADCDISYVQMRKLALGTQVNPPRPKLIRKVAAHAFGEVDLEDLMFAAGLHANDSIRNAASEPDGDTPFDKYRSLPLKYRKQINRFIDFLVSEAENEKEQEQD